MGMDEFKAVYGTACRTTIDVEEFEGELKSIRIAPENLKSFWETEYRDVEFIGKIPRLNSAIFRFSTTALLNEADRLRLLRFIGVRWNPLTLQFLLCNDLIDV